MRQLEDDLRVQLARRAEGAPVGGQGQGRGRLAIERRLTQRAQARRRRRAVGGLGLAAAVSVAVVAFLGGQDSRQQVATGPLASGVPRLLLSVPGLRIEHADVTEGPLPADPGRRIWVLTEPGAGFGGKVVFVQRVGADGLFGMGEASPNVQTVDVAGLPAYLSPAHGVSQGVRWRLVSGVIVEVVGVRLTEAELISVARGLVSTDGRDVAVPPDGYAVLRAEAATGPARVLSSTTVEYAGQGVTVRLSLSDGGGYVVGAASIDALLGAVDVRDVSVLGRAGLLATMSDSHTLVWEPRPGVAAVMHANGLDEKQFVAAAESIREVDEATWHAAVDPALRPRPSPAEPDGGLGGALARVCDGRDAWLAGDQFDRGRAVVDVQALLSEGTAAGWGERSDLLVVIEQLVRAMQAGDVAAVRATPAGGCP